MCKLTNSPRIIVDQFLRYFPFETADRVEMHWENPSAMIRFSDLSNALTGLNWAKEIIADNNFPLSVSLTSSLVKNHIVQIKYIRL